MLVARSVVLGWCRLEARVVRPGRVERSSVSRASHVHRQNFLLSSELIHSFSISPSASRLTLPCACPCALCARPLSLFPLLPASAAAARRGRSLEECGLSGGECTCCPDELKSALTEWTGWAYF